MHSISIICGVVSAIIALGFSFRLIFSDADEFWDCIKFWFTPDCFSLFNGEYWDDVAAEFKLGLWILCGGGVGFLVANGVQSLF